MEPNNTFNFSYDYEPIDYDPEDIERTVSTKIILSLLYGGTLLVSLISNILVIIVLGFVSRTRSDLTVFLINLAVGDLFMAIFVLPFRLTRLLLTRWVFGAMFCALVSGIQVWFVALSIFTNLAIGIDRYWAIVHPLRPRLSKSGAKIAIVGIWILATGFAVPSFLVTKQIYNPVHLINECRPVWPSDTFKHAYIMALFVCSYAGPVLTLVYVYGCICCTLYDRRSPGNADEIRDQMQLESKKKIIKMLIAVVASFTFCWLPIEAYRLVRFFAPQLLVVNYENYLWMDNLRWAVEVSINWLAMTTCFVNPVIFGFKNDNFRADLKKLLTCQLGSRSAHHRLSTRSTISRTTKTTSNGSTRTANKALSRRESGDKMITKVKVVQTTAGSKVASNNTQLPLLIS